MTETARLPSFDDIQDASERLKGLAAYVYMTDEKLGAKLLGAFGNGR